MSAAAAIADAAVRRRVLVVGSPPPGGRDLDLLVRPQEDAAVARALEASGYGVRGNTWARFAGGSADVVDLVPAAEWGGGDALFDEGVPLAGFSWLVVPAPHHDLLLAAMRFLTPAGRLKPGRLARLSRDPAAWRRARAEAPAWNAAASLERLSALVDSAPVRDRRASVRAMARGVRHRRHGAVVALSGLDSTGTRAQAEALVEALDRLGHDAAVESVPARGALAAGGEHARRAARHLAAGRVVVFDRYELDAVVRLRVLAGKDRDLRAQRRVLRLLSPRPVAAFHLDVSGEDLPARLYREERDALGVRALDGTRPADELAAEVAERVWRALPE